MRVSEEFVDIPGRAATLTRRERRNVRMILIGEPDDVELVMLELHTRQFCDVGLWSRPLRSPQGGEILTNHPHEVIRIYKRYLTR